MSKTVVINGRHYDARTGLPVRNPSKSNDDTSKHPAASAVHASAPQRSQTLNRRTVKRIAEPPLARPSFVSVRNRAASAVHKATQSSGRAMDIARSKRVSRFAPAPTAAAKVTPKPAAVVKAVVPKPEQDHPPVPHPIAKRVLDREMKVRKKHPAAKSLTSSQVKQQEIAKALSKPSPSRKPQQKQGFWARHRKLWVTLGIVIVILAAGGTAIFVNLPAITVAFAGQQAGIRASYPGFTPDGYGLNQPVTFSDGQVTLHFASKDGTKGYIITEARSSWDSSAVLANVVQKNAGSNYITTQDSGLTIYSYKGNAVWVNNSILYTITTQASLSNEQLRNIATSL